MSFSEYSAEEFVTGLTRQISIVPEYEQLEYEKVRLAQELIKPHFPDTPLVESHFQKQFTMSLYYKLESLLPIGSFKERGALNKFLHLLPNTDQPVVIGTLGNAALAIAKWGCKLGFTVITVMPQYIGMSVRQRVTNYGAQVVIAGTNLLEAMIHARWLAEYKHFLYIDSRDDVHLFEGYGTIALEILKQLPLVDAILVPVGTGGLAAAIATVIKHDKPECLVYGVQPNEAQTFTRFKQEQEERRIEMQKILNRLQTGAEENEVILLEKRLGELQHICSTFPTSCTLADSIAVSHIGVNSFFNAHPLLDRLVTEKSIGEAIVHIMEVQHLVAEGAGAIPLAAILENLVPELKTKRVVCILSGANMPMHIYVRSLERGLSGTCRLVRFEVEMTVETNSEEHGFELKKILEKAYPYTAVFATPPLNKQTLCPCHKHKWAFI